jgi:hypothetical protein
MKWYDALVLVFIAMNLSIAVSVKNETRSKGFICIVILMLTVYTVLNISLMR